jgi:hypothetical protein
VEGGHLAARKRHRILLRIKYPGTRGWPAFLQPGWKPRLYGRQDARRYIRGRAERELSQLAADGMTSDGWNDFKAGSTNMPRLTRRGRCDAENGNRDGRAPHFRMTPGQLVAWRTHDAWR